MNCQITMIESPTDDDWLAVKTRAIVTMGLTKVKNAPDTYWKHSILKSRHSPIRRLFFSFFIKDVPYCIAMELARHHEGVEKFIKSQRNDRQSDYDRNAARQDAPVNMIIDFNAEGLITICEKRLCSVATPEARQVMTAIKNLVLDKYPEFEGLLEPFCVKYHVCNEIRSCGRLAAMEKKENDLCSIH